MFDHKHVYVSLLKRKCLKVKHVSVSCFYSAPLPLKSGKQGRERERSCFDVSVARSFPVYRYVSNVRGIDRSAFVADLETELVGNGHSLSADQYNVTLLSVLDKHAPAAKSRVIERMSSPWFGLVREYLSRG